MTQLRHTVIVTGLLALPKTSQDLDTKLQIFWDQTCIQQSEFLMESIIYHCHLQTLNYLG